MKSLFLSTVILASYVGLTVSVSAQDDLAQNMVKEVTCQGIKKTTGQIRLVLENGVLTQIAFDNIIQGQSGQFEAVSDMGARSNSIHHWSLTSKPTTLIATVLSSHNTMGVRIFPEDLPAHAYQCSLE